MNAKLPPEDMGPEESEEPKSLPSADEPQVPSEPVPETEGRDRQKLAAEVELNPGSLVGSWFHRIENGEIVWDGIVVGEVQAGYYLLQIRSRAGDMTDLEHQVLRDLKSLLTKDEDGYEFRFYDTKDAMMTAYAAYAVREVTG